MKLVNLTLTFKKETLSRDFRFNTNDDYMQGNNHDDDTRQFIDQLEQSNTQDNCILCHLT